jgi:hypothetical protein
VADLAGALDDALRARYSLTEVRTPATQRRGLLARMNQLEKAAARPKDRAGQAATRAAKAAGIPDRTWRAWRAGGRKPSEANLRKLEQAYNEQITRPALRRRLKGQKAPNKVEVTAEIRWTDSDKKKYNATKHRTTVLTGMGPTMARVIRAWAHRDLAGAADLFERGASGVYRVPDDDDGSPGIRFEGDNVHISFPRD